MQETPTPQELQSAIRAANNAVGRAKEARRRYRYRNPPTKKLYFAEVLEDCQKHGRVVRRLIGMAAAHDFDREYEMGLKHASADLQYERNQLRKGVS